MSYEHGLTANVHIFTKSQTFQKGLLYWVHFSGLQMVTAAVKLKDAYSLERKL